MPQDIFVSTHVHTDGPIPGPHSLLTIAVTAAMADGSPISQFAATLRGLPGATPHPAALAHWRSRPEEWLSTRRASRPPALVVADLVRWVCDLPGDPVFVTDHGQDHMFLYWYLQRFAGQWPFARTISDPGVTARFDCAATTCVLRGCMEQLLQAA
jgi:hypothetical protein